VELTFYNQDEDTVNRNVYKLIYRPEIHSYEVIIDKIEPDQIINFDAYIIHSNEERKSVSGTILINGSTESLNNRYFYLLSNINKLSLFTRVNLALNNTFPWLYILLFALLTMVAWAIRHLLKKL